MNKQAQILRQATPQDFKEGVTLITDSCAFTILRKYDEGIWEARGTEGQGEKCVYEGEARFYKVAV